MGFFGVHSMSVKKKPIRNRSGELHVRHPEIVARVKAIAEKQERTLNTQAVIYLREGLERDETR